MTCLINDMLSFNPLGSSTWLFFWSLQENRPAISSCVTILSSPVRPSFNPPSLHSISITNRYIQKCIKECFSSRSAYIFTLNLDLASDGMNPSIHHQTTAIWKYDTAVWDLRASLSWKQSCVIYGSSSRGFSCCFGKAVIPRCSDTRRDSLTLSTIKPPPRTMNNTASVY